MCFRTLVNIKTVLSFRVFRPNRCGKVYKKQTRCPIKIRLEEHQKTVCRGEIENSVMSDHI